MTTKEQKLIQQLRDRGYAIVIFTPKELQGASPDHVEDELVSNGWDIIETLKDDSTASALMQK